MARSVMPAGAVALMQGQGSKAAGAATDDGMLKGVCDIHLHCRPDSRERSADEFGFMQDAVRAGYRAVMFKSNDFSCHDRAYIIRQALPGAQCFGSVCMNRVHGDKVNVFAAQKACRPAAACAGASGCPRSMPLTTAGVKAGQRAALPWSTTAAGCCPRWCV